MQRNPQKYCIFTAVHCDLSELKFSVLITTVRLGHSRIICFTCIYMTGFFLFFFFLPILEMEKPRAQYRCLVSSWS